MWCRLLYNAVTLESSSHEQVMFMASDPNISLQPDYPGQDNSDSTQDELCVTDKKGVSITTGNVSGTGIAIGPGAQSNVIFTEEQAYKVSGLPNPYLGLRSFTSAERDIFAGRERIVRTLVDRLSADDGDRLLLIVGASGSGKSSLARAGLLPDLADRLRDAGYTIQTRIIDHPGRMPATLLSHILRDAPDSQSPQFLLLLIDQFEEIFSQTDSSERDAALNLLADEGASSPVPLRIIATMRSDFLPHLITDVRFEPYERRKVVVRAMDEAELQEAIQRPIQVRYPDKRLEPALVKQLAGEAVTDAGYLPLLQVTLEDLWHGGNLRLGAYRGLAKAIQRRADTVYNFRDHDGLRQDTRTPEEQAAVLNLFLDLVRVSLGDEQHDVRWRRLRSELTSVDGQRDWLITDLASARLLRTDREIWQDEEGKREVETVDIVHETLLNNWPTLQVAIDAKRESLRQRERFILALNEWRNNVCSEEYLLAEVRLSEAEKLKQRGDNVFKQEGSLGFYERSLKKCDDERHRRERRQGLVIATLSVLLFIALVTSGLATWRTLEAQDAQHREEQARLRAEGQTLAVQSQLEVGRDPDLALLLSVEAAKKFPSAATEDALRQAIAGAPLTMRGHYGPVFDMAISPDDHFIVTNSGPFLDVLDLKNNQFITRLSNSGINTNGAWFYAVDFSKDGRLLLAAKGGTVFIWRVEDWRRILAVSEHKADITDINTSPDDTKFVTASQDGTARICDIVTGEAVHVLKGHNDRVNRAVFSPDGRQVATASWDHTVKLWDATTGVELRTFEGHTDIVRSLAFSADGSLLVSGGLDQTARVWDVITGKQVSILRGHTSRVTRVLFNERQHQIITASADATIKVWDLESGTERLTLKGHEASVTSLVLVEQDNKLYSSGVDGALRQWDLATGQGELLAQLAPGYVGSIAESSDGTRIVTTATDWSARVWDTANGKLLLTLRSDEASFANAVFSADNQQIMTAGGLDNTIRIWDANNGTQLAKFSPPGTNSLRYALFSPDRKTIAASIGSAVLLINPHTGETLRTLTGSITDTWKLSYSSDGHYLAVTPLSTSINNIEVFDLTSDKVDNSYTLETSGWVRAISFHPTNDSLAAVSVTGEIIIWNLKDRSRKVISTDLSVVDQEVHPDEVGDTRLTAVDFSPDGKLLLTAGLDSIRIWDIETETVVRQLRGHGFAVQDAIFGLKENFVISGDSLGSIKIWRPGQQPELPSIGRNGRSIYQIIRSLDDSILVTVGDEGAYVWDQTTRNQIATLGNSLTTGSLSPDKRFFVGAVNSSAKDSNLLIRLWDMQSHEQVAKQELVSGGSSFAIDFNPDGSRIAVVGEGRTAWILDAKTLSVVLTIDNVNSYYSVAWSNDGQKLLIADLAGPVKVFNTDDGTLEKTYHVPTDIRVAQFSPDASRIAVGFDDGSVELLDASKGTTEWILSGHVGKISSIAFSPDNNLLVSTSMDGTAKLWDVHTGELRSTLKLENIIAAGAVFSADGSRLYIAGMDGIIRQYYVHIDDLILRAKQLVGRELSPEERTRFLGQDVSH